MARIRYASMLITMWKYNIIDEGWEILIEGRR